MTSNVKNKEWREFRRHQSACRIEMHTLYIITYIVIKMTAFHHATGIHQREGHMTLMASWTTSFMKMHEFSSTLSNSFFK